MATIRGFNKRRELSEHPGHTNQKVHGHFHKRSVKKITIQRAARILSSKGYKLGPGRTDLKKKTTFYKVREPSGKTVEMSARDIQKLVADL